MVNFILFCIANILIVVFLFLMVKNYRQLSRLVGKDLDKNIDPLYVRFIAIIFHFNYRQLENRQLQKKIIRYFSFLVLLVWISEQLYYSICI